MKNNKLLNSQPIAYLKVCVLPLCIFILVESISRIFFQEGLFETDIDTYNFLRGVSISVISSYALSVNMSTGRMDLSLGSQGLIGCLIGGNIALSLGMGGVGVMISSMIVGAIAGLIVGLLFVTLRLHSFVLGIGMALVYEALSAAYAPLGFQLYGNPKVTLLSNVWYITLMGVVVIILMYTLMQKSTFGLQYNAIRGSQRVAINSGVRVTKSAILCYTLCGALIAISSVLDSGYKGYTQTSLNMTSTALAFTGFVPVFLAMYLQKYCPLTIGIPIAVITFKFISMGLAKMNLPEEASAAITMAILIVFLVVMNAMNMRAVDKKMKLRHSVA